MARHSHQGAIERAAAVIIKVADRYSSDELDTALKTARNPIQPERNQRRGQRRPNSDRNDRRRPINCAQQGLTASAPPWSLATARGQLGRSVTRPPLTPPVCARR